MEVIPDVETDYSIPVPWLFWSIFAESGAETAYEWTSVLGLYLTYLVLFFSNICTIHDVYLMYDPVLKSKEKYKEKPSPWY